MSGHITRMSRGSSVGSSASRPSRTSRSTSIWRAGPWQLCTCTERSSVAQRPAVRPHRVGGDVGLQPAQQRVGQFYGHRGIRRSSASAGRLRCSSRRSRPRVASSGCPTSRWLVSSRRGIWPCIARERLPQVVAGVRQPQVEVVVGGQGVEQLDLGGGQPGVPEQRQPLRQVRSVTPAALQVFCACRTCGGSASTRSSSARHRAAASRGRHRASPAPSVRVPAQSTSSCGRWRRIGREQPGEPARDGVAPAVPQLASSSPLRSGRDASASVRHHGSSQAAVDHLEQRPRPWRRATTGRRRRCR